MIWLTKDMVEAFHRESLVRFGGSDGLRDEGLMLSALARPENIRVYEPDADIFRLAAAYCTGIVKNHPFIDGNKRTALVVMRTFLQLNGYNFNATQEEKYLTFLKLAEGNLSEEELANWIHEKIEIID